MCRAIIAPRLRVRTCLYASVTRLFDTSHALLYDPAPAYDTPGFAPATALRYYAPRFSFACLLRFVPHRVILTRPRMLPHYPPDDTPAVWSTRVVSTVPRLPLISPVATRRRALVLQRLQACA